MVNWQGLHGNLSEIGQALGARAKEQRLRTEAMHDEYQKALAIMQAKAEIEFETRDKQHERYLKRIESIMNNQKAGSEGDLPYGASPAQPQPTSQAPQQQLGQMQSPQQPQPIMGMGNFPQQENQPQWVISPNFAATGEGNPFVENPAWKQAMNLEEKKKIEDMKPYTAEEIKLASGLSLIPQIDKLINLIDKENVYGEGKAFGNLVPFGASRISSFGEDGPWSAFKRGLTAGAGRKAGLILQDIKQIMFATGGQALTDPEIIKLGPKMEPAYKTEEEWIADLKDVRQRIIEKARLLRPNPNETYNGRAFSSVEEADAANLPPGTEIMVGGRRAIVE